MGLTTSRWEHLPHQADRGVHGIGAWKAEAFAKATFALTVVITDPRALSPGEKPVARPRKFEAAERFLPCIATPH
jgi:SHS2 domain-containing protein